MEKLIFNGKRNKCTKLKQLVIFSSNKQNLNDKNVKNMNFGRKFFHVHQNFQSKLALNYVYMVTQECVTMKAVVMSIVVYSTHKSILFFCLYYIRTKNLKKKCEENFFLFLLLQFLKLFKIKEKKKRIIS